MIERATTHFGRLIFDRDAIVRAALRAYVETSFFRIARFDFPAARSGEWTGDLKRGTFVNFDGCLDYEVIAWTEAGIVGLALDGGQGPIQQLGLSVDAVTGGPDDVRGAVPGLPEELEPALVMAAGMLATGRRAARGTCMWCMERGWPVWASGSTAIALLAPFSTLRRPPAPTDGPHGAYSGAIA